MRGAMSIARTIDSGQYEHARLRWMQETNRKRLGTFWRCGVLGLAILASGCASLPTDVTRTPSSAFPPANETTLGKIATNSSPDAELSGFRLMPSANYALSTRVKLARRAERSIDIQYYELQNDETGRYILRLLRDAALKGVRVRLLLDDLHTLGEDLLLLGLAATPNVEIRLFNP
jgi:putative cardiolipin synthase